MQCNFGQNKLLGPKNISIKMEKKLPSDFLLLRVQFVKKDINVIMVYVVCKDGDGVVGGRLVDWFLIRETGLRDN